MNTEISDVQSLNAILLEVIGNTKCESSLLAERMGTQEEVITFIQGAHFVWTRMLAETVFAWFDLQMSNDALWSDIYMKRYPEDAKPYDDATNQALTELMMIALPYIQDMARKDNSSINLLYGGTGQSLVVLKSFSPQNLHELAREFPGIVRLRLSDTIIWSDIMDAVQSSRKPRIKNTLKHAITLLNQS
jgi:hypothetical protein